MITRLPQPLTPAEATAFTLLLEETPGGGITRWQRLHAVRGAVR